MSTMKSGKEEAYHGPSHSINIMNDAGGKTKNSLRGSEQSNSNDRRTSGELPKVADASLSHQASTTSSTERERQTLLLMLLAQVCSLHDATPRTFVVHVLALFERGILDNSSIQFLFDLGLVPNLNEPVEDTTGKDTEQSRSDAGHISSLLNLYSDQCKADDCPGSLSAQVQQAIVPYCSNHSNQHPWSRYLPPSQFSHQTQAASVDNSEVGDNLDTRQKEACAIRKHLERHESCDSSQTNSVYGSTNSHVTTRSKSPVSSSVFAANKYDRKHSSDTPNTLSSAEESFLITPNQCQVPVNSNNANVQSNAGQIMTNNHPRISSSWSVEHHPLSLSRYQREFTQMGLLATGAFGSVYHAIHKLEHRSYAVKCVTFSTSGYYANTLALVIREVRCLAQLDHPNCVRYYTSWLEPSWLTGDQNLSRDNLESSDYPRSHVSPSAVRHNPKLLTDFESVMSGISKTDDVNHTVERLETILYGYSEDSDGFDWTTNSRPSAKYSSSLRFDRFNKRQSIDWGNLPSQSVYSLSSASEAYDSDVSEWTKELDAAESYASHWDSKSSSVDHFDVRENQAGKDPFHCLPSQLTTQDLLTSHGLMQAPETDQNQHCRQPTQNARSAEQQCNAPKSSSTYKYRICLFIQMQLCHPKTLADWIFQRNNSSVPFSLEEKQARARPAFDIFHQIVSGLTHVHSKGIIHRDLKPANIFAGDNGNWCIGDFGLSKLIRDAHPVSLSPYSGEFFESRNCPDDGHTAGVGTASYAAPEQIAQTHYGEEVDIFALGMILLELFSDFTSEHERATAFHTCRHRRELDPWIQRTYPEISALILACTERDHRKRPTANDILNASVIRKGGNCTEIFRAELKAMKVKVEEKDSLIFKQNELLKEKDKIIEDLRRRVADGCNLKDGS